MHGRNAIRSTVNAVRLGRRPHRVSYHPDPVHTGQHRRPPTSRVAQWIWSRTVDGRVGRQPHRPQPDNRRRFGGRFDDIRRRRNSTLDNRFRTQYQ
jgi:hypothetical protein